MRDALAKGYVSKAPSFNSIFHYSQMESLTPYLKQLIAESAKPLQSIETDFAVDASGFSTCTYARWFDAKYGKTESWHDWVKMHVVCGVKTHIITGVEVTRAAKHESPLYPGLLEQTAKAGFTMREVSADKGSVRRTYRQRWTWARLRSFRFAQTCNRIAAPICGPRCSSTTISSGMSFTSTITSAAMSKPLSA
jgi:hypothetical protein